MGVVVKCLHCFTVNLLIVLPLGMRFEVNSKNDIPYFRKFTTLNM